MKYAIEIADKANRNLIFQPTAERLRGRWDSANCRGRSSHQFLSRMPAVIPGIVIFVDTDERRCGITDPLSFEENKSTLDTINSAYRAHPEAVTGEDQGPWPTVIQEKCSIDTMKTWIFWMRRVMDAGHGIAYPRFGQTPPTTDVIVEKMPGKAFVSQFNMMKTRNFAFNEDIAVSTVSTIREEVLAGLGDSEKTGDVFAQ